MQLRPRFHQPPLPPRQETGDQFHRVETEDGHILLIIGVEMWHVMRCARLSKHANNDPEKPADFRHALLYPCRLLVRTVQPGAGRLLASMWGRTAPATGRRRAFCGGELRGHSL